MTSWTARHAPALEEPQFRLLFIGTTFMQVAFAMMMVVQGAVAFDLTGKNSAVGLVSLGMGVSMITLGPIGGSVSDRVSKRRLLLITQLVMAAMYATTGVFILTDLITIPLLVASTVVMGAMFAFMGPTRQAWVGDLLEGERLVNGVALQQIMMNATRIAGPLLAGALVAVSFIGTGGAYLGMFTLFAIVITTLLAMAPTAPRPGSGHGSIFSGITDGAAYIWREPQLRLFTLMFVGVVLSGFSYQTIMPGLLENELDRSTSSLGLIYGAAAAGGIITTLGMAGRRPTSDPSSRMFLFGVALALGLLVLAVVPSFALALIAAVFVGAASSGFQLLNNMNLMQRTRPEYLGRVMSVTMMAFGVNSMVAYPIGEVADQAGERATIVLLGIACFAVVALGFIASRGTAYRDTLAPGLGRQP